MFPKRLCQPQLVIINLGKSSKLTKAKMSIAKGVAYISITVLSHDPGHDPSINFGFKDTNFNSDSNFGVISILSLYPKWDMVPKSKFSI